MFDPERDHDPGPRRFYLRLLAVVVISLAGCAALYPSVTAFSAGADHDTGCLAIEDGWHHEVAEPSASDVAAAHAVLPPAPTPAQLQDPEFMARWRVEWRAAQASPAVAVANARADWLAGAGACVPESRHRLIVSSLGVGALLLVGGGVSIARRTRKSLRRAAAEFATA